MSRAAHAITPAERARIEQLDRLVVLGGAGVRELIGALGDPSWTVRRAAIGALVALGDEAVAPLCTFLADRRDSENAIAAAVEALSGSLGASVVPQVLRLVDHPQAAVVADAAQILGRRRAAEAASVLARLTDHADDNVAFAAIEALGAIGGNAAIESLIVAVERRRFFRTFAAMQVLARTGDPRAVGPLAALVNEEIYRFEAVRALGRTGAIGAIAPIAALLQTPSEAIVRLVASALADLIERADWSGTGDRVDAGLRTALAPYLGRLAGALRDALPDERISIATVLGRAGDATVLPQITTLLDDATAGPAATTALEQLGASSEDALLAALASSDATRRAAILPVLRSRQGASAVREALRDADAEVRARACEALARIGDTMSVPLLFGALGDRSPRVAHAAVSAIQTLGASDTEELALEAARSTRPGVRRHALRILGAFGYPSAFDVVRIAVDDPDTRIVEVAIVALGGIDDARVDGVLEQLATSRHDLVRAAVMRAASHRSGQRAAALLGRGLADTSPWVRYYAVQGLGRIGLADAPQATQRIVERLDDSAPQVRLAAIDALSQLRTAEAWTAVCAAARSSDPDQRRAGLVGIGVQGASGAFEILAEAAASPDAATRLVALPGLARHDDPRAIGALESAIADPAPEVSAAALSLLAERGDAVAAQILVDLALRSDPAHPVHRALSRPSAAHVVAILARLTSADDRAAGVLVAALSRMRLEAATRALFEVLAMANPAARGAAASALISLDPPGARDAVTRLAQHDPDLDVRKMCAAALVQV